MHLLLINPWIYDFAAYDYWLKPLGLLSIAALLRKNGFKLHLIDCLDRHHPSMVSRIKGKKLREDKRYGHGQFFKEEIQKPFRLRSIPRCYSRYGIHPDIFRQELKKVDPLPKAILITTMMTYWYPGTLDTLLMVRQVFPNIPVIIGGNYVTLCPQHALNLEADFYVYGHGGKKVLDILSQITGKVISYPPDEDSLDHMPYPAFDLFHEKDYICIQTSKGCPFQCAYCASNILNRDVKRASPMRIVDEIEYWANYHGVRNIVFYDDALLFEPEDHIIPILKEIIQKEIKGLFFHTPNGLHARFITSELANLMFKSGFKTIRLGYETSDLIKQSLTGGKVNDEELETALIYLKEAGFSTSDLGVYILMGLPEQDVKEVEKSIHQVVELGGNPILTEFSPVPGTSIWEKAIRYSKYDLANDPIFHNNSILPCEWSRFTWQDYFRIKLMANEIHCKIKAKSLSDQ